jgi:hypothetical protein
MAGSKRLLSDDDTKTPPPPPPSLSSITPHPCLSFLEHGKNGQNHPFTVRNGSEACGGISLIANQALPPGSLLFRLPFHYMLSYTVVRATALSQVVLDGVALVAASESNGIIHGFQISPEELTWINMVAWLVTAPPSLSQNEQETTTESSSSISCFPHIYLNSLSAVPPILSAWPELLKSKLVGSNVYAVIDDTSSVDTSSVIGSVVVVPNLLTKLERIRNAFRIRTSPPAIDSSSIATPILVDPTLKATSHCCHRRHHHPASTLQAAMHLLMLKDHSIFSESSISWARGHFLSRRFPELFRNDSTTSNNKNSSSNQSMIQSSTTESASSLSRPTHSSHDHHFLAGYGNRTSTFIPVLDLMNHTCLQSNSCTLRIINGNDDDDGDHVEVRSPQARHLQPGDELLYCYDEHASNEVLLQGYGFCVPDNPADTVQVKVVETTSRLPAIARTFRIGRGGVAAIPSDMWRAIAAAGGNEDESLSSSSPTPVGASSTPNQDTEEEEEAYLEIGFGDLQVLLEYMSGKLALLNSTPTRSGGAERIDRVGSSSAGADRSDPKEDDLLLFQVRLSYVEMYKKGQREILESLIHDLSLMIAEGPD